MQYKLLRLNDEEKQELLPEYVLKLLESGREILFIGALEYDAILGLAAISRAEKLEELIELLYIYVDPEERETGIAAGILGWIDSYFAGTSTNGIFCKVLYPLDELISVYRFLEHSGFSVVSVDGRYMEYSMKQILENPAIKELDSEKSNGSVIKVIKDFADARLKQFAFNSFRDEFPWTRESYVGDFCRYLVKNNIVLAGIYAELTQDNRLLYSGMSSVDGLDKKPLFWRLFLESLKGNKEKLSEETKICFHLLDESIVEIVKEHLQDPEREMIVQEYLRPIKQK